MSQLKETLPSKVFFCDAALEMNLLGPTIPSISFLSIDAVGSEILTALHE